ncbi:MAG: histidine triad (HIT) family protein [Methanobacteriota archaeon]|jgi:histidine triad (HIT) family protein|uniref:HIT family protein n=1 Tax=Halorutilus salinus TaxID=2487751 RepID=A0A9Q4GHH3_9EURY|nr:HIT family protein [Halorutilus salinus]MCX2817793.1 HIT family protein [Halorutilus salinus]
MTDCVFCSILDDEIPSYGVYEDDETYAFLDANPLARGHTLVIPKTHAETLGDLDDGGKAVFETTRRLAPRTADAVDAPAYNLGLNNGEEAGQEVPHAHMHIVPRFDGDGGGPIHALQPSPPSIDDEELAEIADSVRDA